MDETETPTGAVVELLAENLRRRRPLVSTSGAATEEWALGHGLPRGGETVLYSGRMYQIVPYLASLVDGERRRAARAGKRRLFGTRLTRASSALARPSLESRAISNQVPVNVMHLLQEAGVPFGALYEDELYSGTLAYDLDMEDVVVEHAEALHAVFKKHGVRRVITIDPHTTMMLRTVYPKVLDGYDVEVRNYLEVLAELAGDVSHGPDPATSAAKGIAIHDSCVLARDEGVIDAPRLLLRGAGVTVRDPENARSETFCCGGPLKSLDPSVGDQYAAKRVVQLRAVSQFATTSCPFCYASLRGAVTDDLNVTDISFYLRRAQVAATLV